MSLQSIYFNIDTDYRKVHGQGTFNTKAPYEIEFDDITVKLRDPWIITGQSKTVVRETLI